LTWLGIWYLLLVVFSIWSIFLPIEEDLPLYNLPKKSTRDGHFRARLSLTWIYKLCIYFLFILKAVLNEMLRLKVKNTYAAEKTFQICFIVYVLFSCQCRSKSYPKGIQYARQLKTKHNLNASMWECFQRQLIIP